MLYYSRPAMTLYVSAQLDSNCEKGLSRNLLLIEIN